MHVIDWYDKNQCHSSNPDVHDKTLGRIFKISHDNDRWRDRSICGSSRPSALVDLQLHRNDWYVRHARRILQERGPDPKVHARLKRILQDEPDVTRKLRAIWALHVTGGLTEPDAAGAPATRERIRPQLGGLTARRGPERVRRALRSSRRWRGRTSRRSCACISRARCSGFRPRSAGTR